MRKVRSDEAALGADVVRLASRFGRYGYRQITNLLRIEGWQVNHKLVRRWFARLGVQTLFIEIEQWRRLYNTVRPHSAYGGRPPAPETVNLPTGSLECPSFLDLRRLKV